MAYKKTVVTNTTLVRETIKVIANAPATAVGALAALALTFTHVAEGGDTIGGATGLTAFKKDTKIKVVGTENNDGIYTIGASDPTDTVITLVDDADNVLTDEVSAATAYILGIEEFVITPTKRNEQTVIDIYYPTGTSLTFSLAPGAFWAAGVALTGAVTLAKHNLLFVETGKYLQADGTMILTLIPLVAEALLTDDAAEVGLFELP